MILRTLLEETHRNCYILWAVNEEIYFNFPLGHQISNVLIEGFSGNILLGLQTMSELGAAVMWCDLWVVLGLNKNGRL